MHRRALLTALLVSALFGGCKPSAGAGAASTGDIVIGHFTSMTGNTAHFGQDTDKAVRLAVDEVNAAGGVLGRQVKVVTLDDRGDSAEASNAVTRLIDVEHASAIIGEVASSLSLAGAPVAQRRKVPMVSPSSTNPKVTQVGDMIFRVCFLDPFQGAVMAKFAKDQLKVTRVAVLKDVKNDYSLGLAAAFIKSFKELGGEVVIEQSYSAGDTDFSAQVTAIKGADVQAIYLPGYYAEVAVIARTAERLGLKIPLLGGDGWDAPDLLKIGGTALEGSYFSNHFALDTSTPRAKKFVEDFTKKYGQPPTGLGALGYDAALVVMDAMKRAGSAEPAKLRDALAATKDLDAVTGKITIDPERNAKKSAVIIKITGGALKYEASVEP